jgi:pimeloyl-ACP methyl ester carboxylesterase
MINHFKMQLFLVTVGVTCFLEGCISVDSILFQPPVESYKDSQEVIKLESEAGIWISALYFPHAKAKRTVLYSHGNAEDLGNIYAMLNQYQKQGYSVFAHDYRGYGSSDGVASEANAYKDVEAAYDYLVNKLSKDPNDIIVHGRSLGSGPSTHLAETRPVGGLILESGFISVFRVVLDNQSIANFDQF